METMHGSIPNQCCTILLYVDQQLVVKMMRFVYLEVVFTQDEWTCATVCDDCPSQLTQVAQLCLHFLGAPPYVNYIS